MSGFTATTCWSAADCRFTSRWRCRTGWLAEEARSTAELKARAANLERLDEMLAAMTDAAQLSDAVRSRLRGREAGHPRTTRVAVPVLLPDGVNALRYASAGLDVSALPDVIPVPPGSCRDDAWEHET